MMTSESQSFEVLICESENTIWPDHQSLHLYKDNNKLIFKDFLYEITDRDDNESWMLTCSSLYCADF